MLDLIIEVGRLKTLPRTGWLLRGVSNPESIAEHSFRVTFVTMLLADELKRRGIPVDVERALKIAIIHDVAEARLTDIPLTAQAYFDKDVAERRAFREMLPDYLELFEDYAEGRTLEGRLVKFADKLEMLVQTYEYERAGHRNLNEFWRALDHLRRSEFYRYFRDLVEELARRRKV
ncbi:HD domain-containing protein [Pyrococcus yayanosii]|uniref:5'-deoxynucleotidase n=1 Tax=Pyrococcus yayanosii (strain CH1 / JCM 16557) TaxID=529709 RepID=F8AG04_PYRYC|nr:HD family hydrolase [Pyrococcus yayanosii]AEH25058.1 metal-dependent phosphohydrolase [Pyrococcus yayanosii CH1]